MVEDGWSFRGGKKALNISIDFGGKGFGSVTGGFWYGLRAIHCLTNLVQSEVRID